MEMLNSYFRKAVILTLFRVIRSATTTPVCSRFRMAGLG
jgi:hypothetical protein